jgi:hypothetical protein
MSAINVIREITRFFPWNWPSIILILMEYSRSFEMIMRVPLHSSSLRNRFRRYIIGVPIFNSNRAGGSPDGFWARKNSIKILGLLPSFIVLKFIKLIASYTRVSPANRVRIRTLISATVSFLIVNMARSRKKEIFLIIPYNCICSIG